jgi:hypothetical protein
METRKSCLEKGNVCPHYNHLVRRCAVGYVHPKGTIAEGRRAYAHGWLNPCPHTVKGQKVMGEVVV